ncbi:MAG TPA: cytochrome c oxidase assembly protein [Gaiellaceae bacterium]|nr:cytochrome c oxidase assembly protein [Gaiellaceae bacterium]
MSGLGTWDLDPATLTAGAVALAVYAQGFARLRRRRRAYAPLWQAASFAAGVLVGVCAIVSPIDRIGEDELLSMHMLQHLMLGDLAPLLVVLGLRGPLSVFAVPVGVLRAIARSGAFRRVVAFLFRPRLAFAGWVAAVVGWHVPAAYDYAIEHPGVHVLEHVSFVVVGTLVWIQLVDPARHSRLSYGGRAAFGAAVFAVGMVLGEVLLATGSLYPHYADVASRPFGWTAGEDQSKAALLMMGEQIATLGTAVAFLVWSHVERVTELEPAGGSPG